MKKIGDLQHMSFFLTMRFFLTCLGANLYVLALSEPTDTDPEILLYLYISNRYHVHI